jgi:hypothetical protein
MNNNEIHDTLVKSWAHKLPTQYISSVVSKFLRIRSILGGTTNVVENAENYLNCDVKINEKKMMMRELREEITYLENEKRRLADTDVQEADDNGGLKEKIKSLPVNDVHQLAQICNISRIQAQLDAEKTAAHRAKNAYKTYL